MQEIDSFIRILPELTSNETLLKDVHKAFSLRVDLGHEKLGTSVRPLLIIFRPQGRANDEFKDVVLKYIANHSLRPDDIILITAFNNYKGNVGFVEESDHKFKVIETIILSQGSLDFLSSQQTFERLARTLVNYYGFKTAENRSEERQPKLPAKKISIDGKQDADKNLKSQSDSRKEELTESKPQTFLENARETVIHWKQVAEDLEFWMDEIKGQLDYHCKEENSLTDKKQQTAENQSEKLQPKPTAMMMSIDGKQDADKHLKSLSDSRKEELTESKPQTFPDNARETTAENQSEKLQPKPTAMMMSIDGKQDADKHLKSLSDSRKEELTESKPQTFPDNARETTAENRSEKLQPKPTAMMMSIDGKQDADKHLKSLSDSRKEELTESKPQTFPENARETTQSAEGKFKKSRDFLQKEVQTRKSEDTDRYRCVLPKTLKFFSDVEEQLYWLQETNKRVDSTGLGHSRIDKNSLSQYKKLLTEISAHEVVIESVTNPKMTSESEYLPFPDIKSRLHLMYQQLKKKTASKMQELLETHKAMLIKQVADDLNIWMDDVRSSLNSVEEDNEGMKKYKESKGDLQFQTVKVHGSDKSGPTSRDIQWNNVEEAEKINQFFSKVEQQLSWIQDQQQTLEPRENSENKRTYQGLANYLASHKSDFQKEANSNSLFETEYFDAGAISKRLIGLYTLLVEKTASRVQDTEKTLEHQKKRESLIKDVEKIEKHMEPKSGKKNMWSRCTIM